MKKTVGGEETIKERCEVPCKTIGCHVLQRWVHNSLAQNSWFFCFSSFWIGINMVKSGVIFIWFYALFYSECLRSLYIQLWKLF
jgi:hypothetical protein